MPDAQPERRGGKSAEREDSAIVAEQLAAQAGMDTVLKGSGSAPSVIVTTRRAFRRVGVGYGRTLCADRDGETRDQERRDS